MKIWSGVLTGCLLCGIFVINVRGQSFALDEVDATAYPEITATFQVVDGDGKAVSNIQPGDFTIFDNGVRVEEADITIECNVETELDAICGMLALDNSASMDSRMRNPLLGTKLDFVKAAALEFIDNLDDNGRWNVGAMRFSDTIKILQMPDNNRAILRSDILPIQVSSGIGTLFEDALLDPDQGAYFALQRGCSGGRNGKKFLVFITDGGPRPTPNGRSGDIDPDRVLAYFLPDITVYAITIDNPVDEKLEIVCRKTGGLVFENVTTLDAIRDLFNLIRIREQRTVDCRITWRAPFTCDYETNRRYSVRYLPYNIVNNGSYTAPNEGDPPTVEAGDERTVCPGGQTQLNAIGSAGRYKWTPADGLDNPDVPNPVFSAGRNEAVYSYTVTLTDDRGCTVSDKVTVRVGRAEVDIIEERIDICIGESVTLEIEDTGGNIQWSPAEGLNNVNSPFPVATPQRDTWYKCRLTSGRCEDVDSVFIRVHGSDLNIDLPERTSVCEGESLVLDALITGAERIEWTPNEGMLNFSTSNPELVAPQAGWYVVRAFSSNECETRDSIFVEVEQLPQIELDPEAAICAGHSIRLDAQSTPGEYRWTPATGLDDPTSLTPLASPQETTLYTLMVTSPGGCTASKSIEVRIDDVATLNLSADQNICPGGSVVLTAEAGQGAYEWSPATGLNNSRVAAPTASPDETTTYTVVHTSPDGCRSEGSVTVTVNELPTVDAGPDVETCRLVPVVLRAVSPNDGANITWTPAAGLDKTEGAAVTATPTETRVYRATIRDAAGCESFDEVTVRVLPAADLEFALTARDADNLLPGARFELDVAALSNNLTAGEVDDFSLTIRYDFVAMKPLTDELVLNPLLQNELSVLNDEQGIITLRYAVPGAALSEAFIATIPFEAYLPDNGELRRTIDFDEVNSSIPSTCISPRYSGADVRFSPVCLSVTRGIQISGTTFGISAPRPSPTRDRIDVSFSVGFAVATHIELFNTLGERVLVLVDERLGAGVHERSADLSALSAGTYMMRMQAGPYVESVLVLVGK